MRKTWFLLGSVLLLGGCSATAPPEVGDCLASLDSAKLQVVNCQKPHAAQVVGVYAAPGDNYPGEDQLQDAARSTCEGAFEEFVGIEVTRSIYDLAPLLPTEDSWNESGDREILCVAKPTGDEDLTASVEGSAR